LPSPLIFFIHFAFMSQSRSAHLRRPMQLRFASSAPSVQPRIASPTPSMHTRSASPTPSAQSRSLPPWHHDSVCYVAHSQRSISSFAPDARPVSHMSIAQTSRQSSPHMTSPHHEAHGCNLVHSPLPPCSSLRSPRSASPKPRSASPRPRSASPGPRSASPMCDARGVLTLPLFEGDVICVHGAAEGIMRLGATGGYLGHVLLILSPPVGVGRHSASAIQYQYVWPQDAKMLWVVRAGESCRDAHGFHETELLLYVNEKGHILIIGEVSQRDGESHNPKGLFQYEEPAKAQLFRCPQELRSRCRLDVMYQVLTDIRNREASWSWGTAVRAFLFSADVSECHKSDDMLNEIKRCWQADPICTSVVIAFWQQYMCRLADLEGHDHAMEWILKWMPVKADRALPGELLGTMERCGWEIIDSIDENEVGAQRRWV